MARFNSNFDAACPFCRVEIENLNHLFLSCPYAAEIWSKTGYSAQGFLSFEDWFDSWFVSGFCKQTTENLIIICWKLWEARNNLIFRHQLTPPASVIFSSSITAEQYRLANKPRSWGNSLPSIAKHSMIKWQPPPPGFCKLNFDGSVIGNKNAASGFVLRDEQGTPIVAGSRNIGIVSVSVAEGNALRDGLYHALINNCKKVLVEGDSKLVIDVINKKCTIPWRLRTLARDIACLASSFDHIDFSFAPREANFVTDAIANHGHSLKNPFTWKGKLPLSALTTYNFDNFSSGCPRGFKL
ncbi:uncharacterized protein LOC112194109 [Rosa chinensis]|uniref:uncharacterized protein LOC112194109 n=1 Tax=Rosa chinensis TaxID=74649 RepID=UPI000D097D70|nr:uncharacterized protein LOC112194109 [Rosa chinensis]